MNRLKNILAIILLMGAVNTVLAQDASKPEAVAALKQLAKQYEAADHLAFNVKYTYASEQQPQVKLDSLEGQFQMNGATYRYMLDNTESVVTQDYAVMLFREDKIMYLTRPVSSVTSRGPLVLPDSLWVNNPAIQYRVSQTSAQKIISVIFTSDGAFKRIEYYINKRSGYLDKIISVVKASELFDASVKQSVDPGSGIITVSFSKYKEKGFDAEALDLSRYFRKQGKDFVTTEKYSDYKIFLGKPNL